MKTSTKPDASAVAFFLEHAGSGYDPKIETEAEGRERGAVALAMAEEWARLNLAFSWSVDPDIDSSDFSDERPAWNLYQCAAMGRWGKCVASLHGIDFGRSGQPWGSTYKRVVEAELASEVMT